jgi:hypothetical protein
MNGTDILVLLAGFGIIALAVHQMRCLKRQDEARARHEQNKRHWRIIDRIEQYGYRAELAAIPDFYVASDWEKAA